MTAALITCGLPIQTHASDNVQIDRTSIESKKDAEQMNKQQNDASGSEAGDLSEQQYEPEIENADDNQNNTPIGSLTESERESEAKNLSETDKEPIIDPLTRPAGNASEELSQKQDDDIAEETLPESDVESESEDQSQTQSNPGALVDEKSQSDTEISYKDESDLTSDLNDDEKAAEEESTIVEPYFNGDFNDAQGAKNGWYVEDGKDYWYENGIKQGTEGRGKEIYDPASNAWYWLDAVQGGAKAVSKDVYQESSGGKWVRYDEYGHMVKGWQTTEQGTYYFDPITGAMVKGKVTIDGLPCWFDEITGIGKDKVWESVNGADTYWYEGGKRQGYDPTDSYYRGKEIYDPAKAAWFWLDNNAQGKKAVSKDVYQPYTYQGEDYIPKWVRYDANGIMIKGWNSTPQGTYYFDPTTGAMAKSRADIDGQYHYFNEMSGIEEHASDVENRNCLKKAKSYLRSSSFSRERLYHQLQYEKFSDPACCYGVNNCGADWYEQAGKKAQSYMRFSAFSRDRLIHQLEYEGFTEDEAIYGASCVGY